jgi:hypothetical protein
MGGYTINMQKEVTTATKVKWLVMDEVVVVVVIVLKRLIQCHRVHRE